MLSVLSLSAKAKNTWRSLSYPLPMGLLQSLLAGQACKPSPTLQQGQPATGHPWSHCSLASCVSILLMPVEFKTFCHLAPRYCQGLVSHTCPFSLDTSCWQAQKFTTLFSLTLILSQEGKWAASPLGRLCCPLCKAAFPTPHRCS